MKTIALERVTYLPSQLSPGVLYVSEEYKVAGHLCACGCGNKIIVPLGLAEWTFTETQGGPSLRPSIGSWQLPCRSHYVISGGQIHWGDAWSETAVVAGRRAEEARRKTYYAARDRERGFWHRLWQWILRLFGRR